MRNLTILFTLALSQCFARAAHPESEELPGPLVPEKEGSLETPWLVGPLLPPCANTIPKTHLNFEPFLYIDNTPGVYSTAWRYHTANPPSHNINIQIPSQFGLTTYMDYLFSPQFYYNWVHSTGEWRFGDLATGLGFQLLRNKINTCTPAIKFEVIELFPTGVYERLQASKLGTDASGGGTYATTFRFTVSHLWRFNVHQYLATRFFVSSTLNATTKVHGLNVYGGDETTLGRVTPGTVYNITFGIGYSFTRNWTAALDIAQSYAARTLFHGTTLAPVGNPHGAYSFSLAPALQFKFNEMNHFLFGCWFTPTGNNTDAFINGVITLNIYI